MIRIQPEKKRKTYALKWQSIDKKAWARMKVKSMFVLTAKANPAVLVSTGNVSLGMSHPSGPHDHAKDITKKT
ncbi:hypothetical protein V2J09_005587 [Rumex salicifolius]